MFSSFFCYTTLYPYALLINSFYIFLKSLPKLQPELSLMSRTKEVDLIISYFPLSFYFSF